MTGRDLEVAELEAVDGAPVVDLDSVIQEFLPRESVTQPEWSRALMRNYCARCDVRRATRDD